MRLARTPTRHDAQVGVWLSKVRPVLEGCEEIQDFLAGALTAHALGALNVEHMARRVDGDGGAGMARCGLTPEVIREPVERYSDLRHRRPPGVSLAGAQPPHEPQRQQVAVRPQLLPRRCDGRPDDALAGPVVDGADGDPSQGGSPRGLVCPEIQLADDRRQGRPPSNRHRV